MVVMYQEVFGWIFATGCVAYLFWYALFVKLVDNSGKIKDGKSFNLAAMVNTGLLHATSAILLADCAAVTAWYSGLNVGVTDTDALPVKKIAYMVGLNWVSTVGMVALVTMAWWASLYPESREKVKMLARGVLLLWIGTQAILFGCILWHAQLAAFGAVVPVSQKIAFAALVVLATTSMTLLYAGKMQDDDEDDGERIWLVDTTYEANVPHNKHERTNGFGCTPARYFEVRTKPVGVITYGFINAVVWMTFLKDQEQWWFAMIFSWLLPVFMMHWTRRYHFFQQASMFGAMILAKAYTLVPGSFYRNGWEDNGLFKDNNYRSLMFLRDQSNTPKFWDETIRDLDRLAFAWSGFAFAVLTGGAVALFVWAKMIPHGK